MKAQPRRPFLGAGGPEAEALLKDRLAAAGLELPAVNEAAAAPEITVVRVPDTPALPGVADAGVRYLALVKDADGFFPAEDDAYWWATEAAAGIGSVFAETADRLSEQGIAVNFSKEVATYLVNEGYSPAFGARALRRTLSKKIGNRLSEIILEKAPGKEEEIEVTVQDGVPGFNVRKKQAAPIA